MDAISGHKKNNNKKRVFAWSHKQEIKTALVQFINQLSSLNILKCHILGIDKDDEHEEEDEKRVSLLKINIP